MNVEPRTCANCAEYNHHPEGDATSCWNGVMFAYRLGTPTQTTREPIPTDVCPDHKTHAEDAFEDLFIESALEAGGLAAATAAADACEAAHMAIRSAARV